MGKHFALALQLPFYTNQYRRKRAAAAKIKIEHIGTVVLILLSASLIMYFIDVNNFATAGYKINQLQNKVSKLSEDYKKLQVQAAEMQSISAIQADQSVLNMVPVSDISYVRTTALTER